MNCREEALALMDRSAAVYLATLDGARPRIRAMVNLRRADRYPGPAAFCRGQEFTVYFGTSAASGKVREIRANPAVSVYYCEPEEFHGLTLSGEMEILDDAGLKETLWDDGWRVYWPAGAQDPDYVVLRLKAARAEGWRGAAPFHFDPGGGA